MWFRKKSKKFELHGFDLSKWNFLGTSNINFVENEGKKNHTCIRSANVFFFIARAPEMLGTHVDYRREYLIVPTGGVNRTDTHILDFETAHEWGTLHLPLWRIGEIDLPKLIYHPSDFLKRLMLIKHNMIFDYDKKIWVYSQYKEEEEKKKTINDKIEEKKDNVVTVRFGKEANSASSNHNTDHGHEQPPQ